MVVAVVIGTRPEAIKLCPVVQALRTVPPLRPLVISTGQHRQMLDQVFEAFAITPDIDLGLMRPDQSLSDLMSVAVTELDRQFAATDLAAVLVQGDTTTALSAALAAFHRRIPVGHVEAGLRTYDLEAPFPEEANRALIGRIAKWNFAPTDRAVSALSAEKVPGAIIKTGNTVVDALLQMAARIDQSPVPLTRSRLVLITGHRRENFGARFREAFRAIAELADRYPDVDFVYPVHLNPNVQEHAYAILQGRTNVQLISPVSYPDLIALMKRSWLILTDSGGIQEEAPSFGVPVLVMRDTTERPEAVEAGVAQLVGTKR
ncbi:MAG TPA: UDP-N-acetylglucosamine 2-epimerase (non-hydrolyzing) [Afifellaceae bacterium]|nr:UDP-N-acetylglucosamine 2-epimerase (non-hydrolyzing) [Afifellaceae bacterium]